MKRYTFAAVTALLVLMPWQRAVRAEPPMYTVKNLGSFGGLVPTITGVNKSGDVVGFVDNEFGSQAVRYRTGEGWKLLTGLTTGFSVATGINDNGDVSGYYFTTDAAGNPVQRAFRYRDGLALDTIAPLTDTFANQALAINATGEVVGVSDSLAFRATPPLNAEALPDLGFPVAVACGVNASGQVAGASITAGWAQHAMRVEPDLTTVEIVGLEGDASMSFACAIDTDGTVGGQSSKGTNSDGSAIMHAFRYRDVGGSIDLDRWGSPLSNVESIRGGVSVGWYTLPDNSQHAFAHRDGALAFDLNDRIDAPGWVLNLAKGVNADGVIVGQGTYNGAAAAFRLTPSAPVDTTPPVIKNVSASPATIFPPNGLLVGVTVTVDASDDSGAAPVCSLTSIVGGNAGDSSFTPGTLNALVRAVGGRTYTLNVSCADGAGNAASAATAVFVTPDTTAPVISSVSANPNNLWPPDGRNVPVTVTVSATDDVDASPVCSLTSITGGAAGDSSITPPLGATLRAVGGTTYTLNVRCTDAAGNFSSGAAAVVVPRDTTAPVIASVTPSQSLIWPPNGKPVVVTLAVRATDDVDAAPQCSVTAVTGGAAGDAMITGPLSVSVKANKGTNYCVKVTCSDKAGNKSTASTIISVSK